jgi:hypothetical protein
MAADHCDTNAACTNTEGSFECACNGLYSGDGGYCASATQVAIIIIAVVLSLLALHSICVHAKVSCKGPDSAKDDAGRP